MVRGCSKKNRCNSAMVFNRISVDPEERDTRSWLAKMQRFVLGLRAMELEKEALS